MNQATRISQLLDLDKQPVAIKFQDSVPAGVSRVDSVAASGCSYWKQAAAGQTFYTEAADHYGCPIGSHTHGINLPEETAAELNSLVGTMVELRYLSMSEVPEIPQLEGEFGVAVYSPAGDAAYEPDVILITGNARQMMLLGEAAHAAGLKNDASMVGRPTCATIPAVLKSGGTATNFGCIGNRVYTELADDELYFVIAGAQLATLCQSLTTIVHANEELEVFHRGRSNQTEGE